MDLHARQRIAIVNLKVFPSLDSRAGAQSAHPREG
jgi:hypothetical protein